MAEVAGWFAAPVIEDMIKKMPSYLKSLYNWQKDVDDNVKELRLALTENLAMVMTAAQQQHTGDNTLVEQWVLQIKDAIYDTEDVLDEFEYRWLKAQADRSGSAVSRTFSYSLTLGKRLIGLDDFRTTLKKMLQRLNRVRASAMSLSQVVHLEHGTKVQKPEVDPTRATSSIQLMHEIFGRDKEGEEIVTMLLKPVDEPEPSSSKKPIPVIPIVGLGGFGKTTLARLVYNDRRIVNHFDIRIWVCVSDSFDKIRLTKDILESMSKPDEKFEDVNNFQKLQESLRAKLESKKFLLVFDDVWLNEKMTDWENKESWDQVFGPLNQGPVGSKILVTTRNDLVANMFGATNRIPLGGLANNEYWSLFKSCAFGNANLETNPELELIGRKIATSLHGSPLAAKAIGALLRDKLDVNEWNDILKKGMSDDIGSILKLSYQRLPDHLKPCFGYCSIFPKDWKFEHEKLVALWIAQGYVQPLIRDQRPMADDRKESFNQMMSRGKEYFNQLLFRSFFQKVEEDSDIYYVMHDLIHDLSQSVSKIECFRINNREISTIPETVRHLGIVVENEPELVDILSQLEKMSNLNKLRTLMFLGNYWMEFSKLSRGVFMHLKSLRVLDLGKLKLEELSGALDHLIYLRYLNIGNNPFVKLPKLLLKLYHLQVLAAENELRFSRSMLRLIKFGRLARLDAESIVYNVEKGRGHRIGVLKDLKKEFPGRLGIVNLENITRRKDAIKADLGSKQELDGLVLEWAFSGRMNRRDVDKEVAEGLKPHQNLRSLKVNGFRGTRLPSWLETNWLISLTTIQLWSCGCLEVLPPLGQLPCLESLDIRSMHAIKRVTSEFYGDKNAQNKGFPSLKYLWFSDMPEWLEWFGVEQFPIFPCLQTLILYGSPKLKSLPEEGLPQSLESLTISVRGVSDADALVSTWLQGLTSLSKLEIQDCDHLTSLPSAQVLRSLTGLQNLRVWHCKELTSLGGLHALESLTNLEVLGCPKLKSLPEEGLPRSVQRLFLYECDPALMQQMREKKGAEWDKVAHIPRVYID